MATSVITGVPSGTGTPTRLRRRRPWREYLLFLLFVLPNFALIGAFTYRPLISNFQFSTLQWTLGSDTARVVGLQNYVDFFTGRDAGPVLSQTAIFTVATVGGSMVLGLLVALALNQNIRGRTFARASVFAPYVLSGVGVGLVWLFIMDPTYGVLGFLLRKVGSDSPPWFNDPGWSLAMIIIVYVWKNIGYCAVVYLAGLQAMPRDVMEAAAIDGCGPVSRFRHVTFPLLSPTTFFLLITTMLNSLQAFDIIKIMAPNSPGTRVLIYQAYVEAFGNGHAGYSAAISVILFLILIVLTIIQIGFVERKVHYS